MMTGAQYKASLNDGRATYFEGKRIDDIEGDPVLGHTVNEIAATYDRFYAPGPDARSPLMSVARSAQDLRDRIPILHQADLVANVTYQSIMTLMTAAAKISDCPKYVERIGAYVDRAQKDDIRIVECITDAKGDRSLSPGKQHDPDAYVRVVDRKPGGVVIRGAKLHISGASYAHDLMTIPTKAMKAGEEAYAIACVVPVNSPGVRIVNTTYAPRGGDGRTFPISAHHHMPEGFVIFDDVFVPEERIFLDGETRHAAIFAHSLGLWERLGGLSAFVEEGDQLVGFAQLMAEANGLAGEPHIREKISEMIIHATILRAGLEAAIANCSITPEGAASPDELYTNAAKYYGAANYNLMVRHLHDIAGGAVVTTPAIADLENGEVGHLVRKYMSTGPGVDGEYRMKLFHAIRDLTADALGGWKAVTNIQAGGGLYAQRIVTRRYYDLAGAKKKALAHARIENAPDLSKKR
jgi:4-hydroxybutyryl-CoA dehydratase/vinylacetyl-CoA-Delta-isomerase